MNKKNFLTINQNVTIMFSVSLLLLLTGCIHDAARKGNLKAINLYASLGGDLDAKERFNFEWSVDTPLILAVRNNQYEAAKLLIELGADIDEKGEAWYTPIHYAVSKGNLEIARLLLDNGAKIEPFKAKLSALHIASKYGGMESVKLLVEHGADVNFRANSTGSKAGKIMGDTPLHYAFWSKNWKRSDSQGIAVVEYLLKHGADVNAQDRHGYPPLAFVTASVDMDIAKLLLGHGADPNIRAKNGCTPLYRAYSGKDVEMAKLLLQHGADPKLECDGKIIPQSFIKKLHE